MVLPVPVALVIKPGGWPGRQQFGNGVTVAGEEDGAAWPAECV